jgi:ribonucleoside-diphosphate reductase beta chain
MNTATLESIATQKTNWNPPKLENAHRFRKNLIALASQTELPGKLAAPNIPREKITPKRKVQAFGEAANKSHHLIGLNPTDVNALLPLRHPQFRQYWKIGTENNWLPQEVSMAADQAQWAAPIGSPEGLTEDQRRMVMINLGFFSTAESLIGNNVVLALYSYLTNPEVRQALLRIAWEESVHVETFMYIVESLGLNEREIYSMYQSLNCIKAKDAFLAESTAAACQHSINVETPEGKRAFAEVLLSQIIMEGLFFYSGFAMILKLRDIKKLVGIGQQYEYIMKDETLHMNIMRDIFLTLMTGEWKEIWDDPFKSFVEEKLKEAVELESAYAKECLPRGILGLHADQFMEYAKFMADRRAEQLGLNKIYHATNPFPWMEKLVDKSKESNFFEQRVTSYKSGPLEFED